MLDRRSALVAAVRRELAAARGAARTALAAAERELAEAQRRRTTVQAERAEAMELLEDARQAGRMELGTRFARQTGALARSLASAASAAAPGAAGTEWTQWTVSPLVRGQAPGHYRIGEIPECGPALVPLLDRAHLELAGPDLPALDGVITAVLLRALGSSLPGAVRVQVFDPQHLGGALAGLAPLCGADLLAYVGPGGLTDLLDDLVEQIRRIHETVLAGEFASLADLAAETGRRPEPWRIAVLLGDGTVELTAAQQAQLDRILRTGVACGVHVVSRGLPLGIAERIKVDGTARTTVHGGLTVTLDPPPPAELVTAACKAIAEDVTAGPPPADFADLMPDKPWTESSAESLVAPIGEGPDGRLVDVLLGDDPPHALIGGPSGSGKTNLIYAWLAALCARYAPAELALYLLDFKEGVSFARFAPSPRDPSWLPHVRLVGVNVNGDREFGLALLRHLAEELRRRAAAAKQHEATKLSELRAEDPAGDWPRIVAVVDEFQVLLSGRDAVAAEAVSLLEDLARRGRSQGIHLVLASQDVSGIEALWGRSSLVAQFTLRIALPKARRILADTNLAAELIPRYHAVVNADSGVTPANRVVRLPDASDRTAWRGLQEVLWRARPEGLSAPRLFDGDSIPVFGYSSLDEGVAMLGETIDVAGRPATMRFGRTPGRNLAVLGTRVDEACAVLASAALSLANAPGEGARFSVACLDPDAEPAARALCDALPGAGYYDAEKVGALLTEATSDVDGPHYIVGYAWDAAGGQLTELRTILSRGPERRVHVLGWWRGVPRLRDDLGGIGARFDAIGGWVALDVHGAELAPLYPQPGGPAWYPRPRRALFFDRAVHRTPELLIPYEVVL